MGIVINPLAIPGYAVGTTRLITRAQKAGKKWIHVMGTTIVEEPACLEGANLLLGLEVEEEKGKSKNGYKKAEGSETAAIHSGYLSGLSKQAIRRWKQNHTFRTTAATRRTQPNVERYLP